MALGIMLLPALIPLYFAMGADEPGVIVFLVSLSFVVALGNLMIVLAMWRWIGRLQG